MDAVLLDPRVIMLLFMQFCTTLYKENFAQRKFILTFFRNSKTQQMILLITLKK
jgi:hypothetical protein